AFLQHSSGTTGLQKGVALSHRAVLAHNRAYAELLKITRKDTIISWLPLYHDMGLIACFILPLLHGVPFVEISPFDWVIKPHILFNQIHLHKATLCWLPNFACSFMVKSVREKQLLPDLSLGSIRAFINCSEPVYDLSFSKFLNRFSCYKVTKDQFTASYAMAENVFAVSQSIPGEYKLLHIDKEVFRKKHIAKKTAPGKRSLTLVSNGRPLKGVEVLVTDPKENPMPSGHVGEFWIRSDFLFFGYFRRRELSETALHLNANNHETNNLSKDSQPTSKWFKTGDLGFILDGHLYITGRKKDLIIIQGKNIYPSDVENTVRKIPNIIPGRVVVFSTIDESLGTERLVVLAEAEDDQQKNAKRTALAIRSLISQELDITPGDVKVLERKWLIKSTSGKPARNDNRLKYLKHFANN
ncbi:MAG: AMP-binding protein, partial [Desulfamplus sp.]|nr:AMP-binding protein [Desulfamplus sp.]